ncbi:hypothetical protein G7Y79_00072g097520 [Physcia stellaris]|nr:hypothetical protein G7Y79_00072g097520 [Physcia stellaris]
MDTSGANNGGSGDKGGGGKKPRFDKCAVCGKPHDPKVECWPLCQTCGKRHKGMCRLVGQLTTTGPQPSPFMTPQEVTIWQQGQQQQQQWQQMQPMQQMMPMLQQFGSSNFAGMPGNLAMGMGMMAMNPGAVGGYPGASIIIGGTQNVYHGPTVNNPAANKGKPWQKGKGSSKGKGKQGGKPSLLEPVKKDGDKVTKKNNRRRPQKKDKDDKPKGDKPEGEKPKEGEKPDDGKKGDGEKKDEGKNGDVQETSRPILRLTAPVTIESINELAERLSALSTHDAQEEYIFQMAGPAPEGVDVVDDEADMRFAASHLVQSPEDIWRFLSLAARTGLSLPRAVNSWLHDEVSFNEEEEKAQFGL